MSINTDCGASKWCAIIQHEQAVSGQMRQQVRALVAQPDDMSLIPGTYGRRREAIPNTVP